ncbi:MAG: hypothetical protein AMXMBFR7_42160 [Planctomycetota bacterium]
MKQSAPWAEKVLSQARQSGDRRGFVLIVIVGMLAVLVVLGLSFAEQGRIELIGAANSRDATAVDSLAEAGFQMALRVLHDDRNVLSAANPNFTAEASNGGVGWTSRYGYNPYYMVDPPTGVRTSVNDIRLTPATNLGVGMTGPAPSHDVVASSLNARNFLDTWQMLFWNEETLGGVGGDNTPFGYRFQFIPGTSAKAGDTAWSQRHPLDPKELTDIWPFMTSARVRRFRVNAGSGYGFVQVGITPKDGGFNLNDVFLPEKVRIEEGIRGTDVSVEESGIYETLSRIAPDYQGKAAVATTRTKYASPDRRTLEYLLGKRPEMANRQFEWLNSAVYPGPATSWSAQTLMGNKRRDDGVYVFPAVMLPWGRNRDQAALLTTGGSANDINSSPMDGYGTLAQTFTNEPTTFYNASPEHPNRYNFEAPRYVMWVPTYPFSLRYSNWTQMGGGAADKWLVSDTRKDYYRWYATGRGTSEGRLIAGNATGSVGGEILHPDLVFQGFGFDIQDPIRGGVGAALGDVFYGALVGTLRPAAYGRHRYIGAGVYGHPKRRPFQLHMVPQVARGRFWTDLMAAWYFGGAPGYTSMLGIGPDPSGLNYNNWAHVGSSYDSIGIGTHWMPPTAHIWMAGKWNKGRLSAAERNMGLNRYPGNMPPTKAAATYNNPMRKFTDDQGFGGAHFNFSGYRLAIRAYGIQENWGNPLDPNALGINVDPRSVLPEEAKWYDAINVNVSLFPVIYGLLTPEKIPSMMNRTSVAPHLHWKSRFLDSELRLCNPNQPFDAKKNYYIPVMLGLKNPALPRPHQWDPETNPWVALRLEAATPGKPWHPVHNPWVKPVLEDPLIPYNPLTNPFLNDLIAYPNGPEIDHVSDEDWILRPYFICMKHDSDNKIKPFMDLGLPFDQNNNPIMQAMVIYNATAPYDSVNNPLLPIPIHHWNRVGPAATTPWVNGDPVFPPAPPHPWDDGVIVDSSQPYAYDTGGLWEPLMDIASAAGANNPKNPGWYGYRFEPREYNTRTFPNAVTADNLYQELIAEKTAGTLADHVANAQGTTAAARTLGSYSYHRHIDPERPYMYLGKMDFFTPEPVTYTSWNATTFRGTGDIADDVFVDCHYDQALSPPVQDTAPNDTLLFSRMTCRPDFRHNWPDWFRQRVRPIPAIKNTGAFMKPDDNKVNGTLPFPEGRVPGYTGNRLQLGTAVYGANNATFNIPTTWNSPMPHALHGLPNPDYLLLYPGSGLSVHWADQFRRYMPIYTGIYPSFAGQQPGAPPLSTKLIDDDDIANTALADQQPVDPMIPVPKETGFLTEFTPFAPRISKGDAWRLTRVGRKYQELIADEIMDYQINPWWPNPVQQLPFLSSSSTDVANIAIPLNETPHRDGGVGFHDLEAHPRLGLAYTNNATNRLKNPIWTSYGDHLDNTSAVVVPDYFTTYNRYWMRGNQIYNRRFTGAMNERPFGEPYRAEEGMDIPAGGGPQPINPIESRGLYPQALQYWGQYPPGGPGATLAQASAQMDRVLDFPYNTLEDALGGDFRYLHHTVRNQTEPEMRSAPVRNHPFRTWADFVAMLGHMVYRPPLPVNVEAINANAKPYLDGTTAGTGIPGPPDTTRYYVHLRDPVLGVNAFSVCHSQPPGAVVPVDWPVDPRNYPAFFDGSKVASGPSLGPAGRGGPFVDRALADALMGFRPNAVASPRLWNKAVVAIDGHWPISGNYGAWPKTMNVDGDPVDPEGNPIALPSSLAFLYPYMPPPFQGVTTIRNWQYRVDEVRGRDAAGLRIEHHYISERAANDVLVSLSNGRIGAIDFDGDGHITMTRDARNRGVVASTAATVGTGQVVARGDFTWAHNIVPNQPYNSFWIVPRGYPYHKRIDSNNPHNWVEWENPTVASTAAGVSYDSPGTPGYGVKMKAINTSWQKANIGEVINDAVTLPIKFRSNTFRVSVVVEMTDARYQDVLTVRRYSRVYSRVPGTPTDRHVHGPYTGEFIMHGSRTMMGDVDPELFYIGASMGQ